MNTSIKNKIFFVFFFVPISLNIHNESINKEPVKKYNILFISSFSKELPAQSFLEQGLNNILNYKKGENNVFFEFLDEPRLNCVENTTLKPYLEEKYRNIQMDFVVGWSIHAGLFVCKNRDFFPNAQRVLLEVREDDLIKENSYSDDDIIIVTTHDITSSLKEIHRLAKPDHIIVIGTSKDATGQGRLLTFKKDVVNISNNIKIDYLLDQDIDAISVKIQEHYLEKTIALYLLMFSDGKGTDMSPYQIVKILSEGSKVPIFSHWDSLMGSGVVGGYLISLDKMGEYLGNVILQFDKVNEKHLSYSPMKYVYDYQALKKWHINIKNIPEEAQIINKPPNIFKYYKWQVFLLSISLLFLIVLFFLIFRQLIIKKVNIELIKVHDELKIKNEELNYLSITDPLTGLINRRGIEKIITDEINRNKRFGHPVSLMMLDLDFFKRINDSYGHVTGDLVLEKISEVIKSNIRVTDKASRWGGEEFLILAANTKLKSALILSEKIRKNIMHIKIGKIKNITASFGVAEYENNEEFLNWYERVDDALYRAKESGRNKVEYSEIEHKELKDNHVLILEWKDEYLSGNETIDNQHYELFNQINEIIDLFIKKEDQKKKNSLIENIFSNTAMHFKDEEDILKEIGYTGLDKHIERHKELTLQFTKLKLDFINNKLEDFLFLEFMAKDLVLNHMLEDDLDYFKCFS